MPPSRRFPWWRDGAWAANYRKLFAATTISNLGDGVGADRLPVAGDGGHPQPAADRPRRRRPAAAVAAVHAARRRDHRPQRPAAADDRRQRRPRPCSPLVVAVAVLAAGARCRRPTRSTRWSAPSGSCTSLLLVATLLLGTCEVLHDNSAQTFLPADRRRPPTSSKANGRMYSAEMVANKFVGPPLGQPAAGRRVRAADRGRRRLVRRRRRARVLASPPPAPAAPAPRPRRRREPWQGRAGRGVPLAVAPPAAADVRHHARLPQHAAARCSFATLVLFGQEVLRHVGRPVRRDDDAVGASAACSAGGSASRIAERIGAGAVGAADLWSAWRVRARRRPRCRRGRSSPCCSASTMFTGDALERDHGEPAPGGHPRPTARPGQQRLPVLRLGGDPDRRADRRRPGRRRSTARCRGSGRCGCRGSSPARPSSCSPLVVVRSLTHVPGSTPYGPAGKVADPAGSGDRVGTATR